MESRVFSSAHTPVSPAELRSTIMRRCSGDALVFSTPVSALTGGSSPSARLASSPRGSIVLGSMPNWPPAEASSELALSPLWMSEPPTTPYL